MNEKIQIKTGSNISSLLQSTVNISQAFTELVKNSIQNLATQVDIVISDNEVSVTDNGKGFDHVADSSGKNDFDRYFVFGNSYDNTSGQGIRLGHMGIGGKLANDKLSDVNTNWTIVTKNKHSKAFRMDYKPPKTEFLDDYNPVVTEVTYDDSYFAHGTGTKIIINTLNKRLINSLEAELGWAKKEIRSFFGVLIQNSKKSNKEIKISLNGEDLSFDYDLPGSSFLRKKINFTYHNGIEEQESSVDFNLFKITDRSQIKGLPVRGVEIIAGVKICELKLDDSDLVEEIYKKISEKEGKEISPEASVLHLFNKLIGFVVCDDLGSVLDETGMPAKDLSHHALRQDHFIVQPFLRAIYERLIHSIRGYLGVDEKGRRNAFNDMAQEVLKLIDEEVDVDVEQISPYETDTFAMAKSGDDEPEQEDEDDDEESEDNNDEDSDLRDNSAEKEIEPEELPEEDYGYIDPEKIPDDMPDYVDPKILPKEVFLDLDGNEDQEEVSVEEITKVKNIIYDIANFGEGYEHDMSSHHMYSKLIVMINSGSHKFKKIEESEDKYAMAAYIAECMVKEIALYKLPELELREVEYKISEFYKEHGNKIKNRFPN